MLKISSRDNQRLKRARRVRDGRIENLIFVEGARLAEEVLRSELRVEEFFFSSAFAASGRAALLLNDISAKNIHAFEVPENIFKSLSDTNTSQGVVLIVRKPPGGKREIESNLERNKRIPLVVVLHGVNNPSNLGAILRTAEAANACGVVTTATSADAFSPKSLRGAMGAAFRLPIWTDADFAEVLNWASERNLITVAADVKAEKSYAEIDWNVPRLLIFGSEAHGLSGEELSQIDETLTIPMANAVESLNLAVSTGIILFEAKRQTSAP